LASEVSVYKCI